MPAFALPVLSNSFSFSFSSSSSSSFDLSELYSPLSNPTPSRTSTFLPRRLGFAAPSATHAPLPSSYPRVPAARLPAPIGGSGGRDDGNESMPPLAVVGDGLVPKRETGVADFVAKYPDCQGDNVVVAILDTGVDPGAPGLRRMPDGSPKVIDCIDCTGGGDVQMFDADPVDNGTALVGLSGRRLVLSPEMVDANPSGSYRVGLKAAYALLPRPLVNRLKRERKLTFEEENRAALNAVRRKLSELKTAAECAPSSKKTAMALAVEECEAQEDALSNAASAFADPGPLYDCVTFFDGKNYRAIVDTTETGVLSSCTLMEDYRLKCRYATLFDLCNYAINVWDDGKTLSICVDSGSHGTHVAGMVASYYPEAPHMNGTAPGSRIVSLKIGDTRLDAMETHTGLNRAMAYLLAHSKRPSDDRTAADDGIVVDLVNMSFGEPTRNPDHGRFVGLANKLVRERNVLFFCSAGNNGPALTSVGAPGGTSDALVGVGAYVTPTMLTEGYSVLQTDVEKSLQDAEAGMCALADTGPSTTAPPASHSSHGITALSSKPNPPARPDTAVPSAVAGMPYTWTSRGPSPDGSLGVSVCAPGGAIAAIPQWNLSRKRLMNGTSMASPAACSTCAVLVSYLKKHNVPYTSDRLRSAIENSARPLGIGQLIGSSNESGATPETAAAFFSDTWQAHSVRYTEDLVFAGGCGSIDVGGACDLLKQVAQASQQSGASADKRGLGDIRDAEEWVRPPLEWRYRVSVETTAPLAARKTVGSLSGCGTLGGTRGIYLRGKAETRSVQRVTVNVDALRDDEKLLPSNKEALAAMETTIFLEASESWVTTPASVMLHGGGRGFPVVVDPTALEVGRVHFCEVNGFVEATDGLRYRVFRVPVTVIVPEPTLPGSTTVSRVENVSMSPGAVLRRFYDPPACCTYAILRVTAAPTAVESCETGTTLEQRQGRPGNDSISEMTSAASGEYSSQLAQNLDGDAEQARLSAGTVEGDRKVPQHSDESAVGTSGALSSDSRLLDIHIVQVAPRQPTKHTETKQALALIPGAAKEILFPVIGGVTVEVAVGHRWSSMGVSRIRSVEVIFCGLTPQPSVLHMLPGAGCFPRLDVTNALPFSSSAASVVEGSVNGNPHVISTFYPKASLTSVRRPVAPYYTIIRPLGSVRDGLPEEKQVFELVLEYKFTVPEKTSGVKVTFLGLNAHVYESAIEGGPFVTIHDANKKLLRCSDIYPDNVSLDKGTYYACASLRHDNIPLLEKLRDLPAAIVFKLPSALTLDIYDTSHGACLQSDSESQMRSTKGKDWKGLIEPGETLAIYLAPPKKSALPSWIKLGDALFGEFSVDEPVLAAGGDRGKQRVPKYLLSMAAPAPSGSGGKSLGAVKTVAAAISSTVSDAEQGKEDADKEKNETAAVTDSQADDAKLPGAEDNGARELERAIQELTIKAMASYLKSGKLKEFDRMYAEAKGSLTGQLEFLLLKLQRLDAAMLSKLQSGAAVTPEGEEARLAVIHAANDVLAKLDELEIASHFGMNVAEGDEGKSEVRQEFETQRASLVAALFRRARAMFCVPNEAEGTDREGREDAYKWLERWQKLDGKTSLVVDKNNRLGEPASEAAITSECLVVLATRRHVLSRRYGIALRILSSHISSSSVDKPVSRRLADLRVTLVENLEWSHLLPRAKNSVVLDFPRGLELI